MLCLVPKRLTSGGPFILRKSDNDLCSFPREAPIEAYRKTPTISQMERGFYFEEWLLQKLQLVKLFVHHIISDHSKTLISKGSLRWAFYFGRAVFPLRHKVKAIVALCSNHSSILKGRDQFAAFSIERAFSQIAPAALCSLNSQCSIFGSLRWAFFFSGRTCAANL